MDRRQVAQFARRRGVIGGLVARPGGGRALLVRRLRKLRRRWGLRSRGGREGRQVRRGRDLSSRIETGEGCKEGRRAGRCECGQVAQERTVPKVRKAVRWNSPLTRRIVLCTTGASNGFRKAKRRRVKGSRGRQARRGPRGELDQAGGRPARLSSRSAGHARWRTCIKPASGTDPGTECPARALRPATPLNLPLPDHLDSTAPP
jgi:hypothetical protein